MKKIVLLLYILALVTSCNETSKEPDCSAVLCEALELNIRLIDSETKENYILNEEISIDDIKVTDFNNEPILFEFNFSKENNIGSISIREVSKEEVRLSIKGKNVIDVSFMYNLPKTNQCCDFGSIENIAVKDLGFKTLLENRIVEIQL